MIGLKETPQGDNSNNNNKHQQLQQPLSNCLIAEVLLAIAWAVQSAL